MRHVDECCISLVTCFDYCFSRLMLVMVYISRNKLHYCVCTEELAVKQC